MTSCTEKTDPPAARLSIPRICRFIARFLFEGHDARVTVSEISGQPPGCAGACLPCASFLRCCPHGPRRGRGKKSLGQWQRAGTKQEQYTEVPAIWQHPSRSDRLSAQRPVPC